MENYKKISNGEVCLPFVTEQLNTLLAGMRSKQVMVPAKWSVDQIIFDFRSRFEQIISPNLPEETFVKAIGSLVDMWNVAEWRTEVDGSGTGRDKKAKKGFKDTQIDKIAAALNIDRDQVIYLGEQLENSFARSMAGNLITPTLIKTLLEDRRYHVDHFPSISTTEAFAVREFVLHLHSLFSESAPWAEIQEYVQKEVAQNSLVRATHQLMMAFRNTDGLSVPMRLDYVVDTIFGDLQRKVFFKTKSVRGLPLVKNITSVDIPDLQFKELMSFYFSYLRQYMGGPAQQTVTLNYRYITDVMTRGQLLWPALPTEAITGPDRVEEYFDRLVLLHLIYSAAMGQPGSTRGLFANFIADKKYHNDDTFFQFVNRWLDALCTLTDAIDSAANFLYVKGMDERIFFSDMNFRSIQLVREFVAKYISTLTTLSLATDHPRYLLQPALLINSAKISIFQEMNSQVPSYFFSDVEYQKTGSYVINPADFSYVSYRRNQHLSGLLFDAPIGDVPKRTMYPPLCTQISAHYFRTFPISTDYAALPAIDFRLRHRSVKSITDAKLFHLLRPAIDVDVFVDAQEFAQKARIPLDLAESLIPSANTAIAAFTGPLLEYYIWPASLAPVYEINAKNTEEGRFAPFVAYYPFFVSSTENGVVVETSAAQFMKSFIPSTSNAQNAVPATKNTEPTTEAREDAATAQPEGALDSGEDENKA